MSAARHLTRAAVRRLAADPEPRGGRPTHALGADAGQSSVELIALLPLVLIVVLAVASLLGARTASGQAAAAAQAGAMALLQDEDPRAAAREALPDGARGRSTISVRGREVAVEVRPRTMLPFLSPTLAASASADAVDTPCVPPTATGTALRRETRDSSRLVTGTVT